MRHIIEKMAHVAVRTLFGKILISKKAYDYLSDHYHCDDEDNCGGWCPVGSVYCPWCGKLQIKNPARKMQYGEYN